jgi:hypothetical protein
LKGKRVKRQGIDEEPAAFSDHQLNRPERLRLLACWEANRALKAMREQIREDALGRIISGDQVSNWHTQEKDYL